MDLNYVFISTHNLQRWAYLTNHLLIYNLMLRSGPEFDIFYIYILQYWLIYLFFLEDYVEMLLSATSRVKDD